MTQTTQASSTGGVGFFGLLTLLFIGLKLGGAITWSWWWILAPLWVPFALGLGGLILFVAIVVVVKLLR